MSDQVVENFEKTHEYSGFWIRVVAWFIDSIILAIVTVSIFFMIYGVYFLSDEYIQGNPDNWHIKTIVDILVSYLMPITATILFWI